MQNSSKSAHLREIKVQIFWMKFVQLSCKCDECCKFHTSTSVEVVINRCIDVFSYVLIDKFYVNAFSCFMPVIFGEEFPHTIDFRAVVFAHAIPL